MLTKFSNCVSSKNLAPESCCSELQGRTGWLKRIVPSSILSLALITTIPIIEANAKTQGSYIKASAIKSSLASKSNIRTIVDNPGSVPGGQNYYLGDANDIYTGKTSRSSKSAYGFGLAYGYAFNYNRVFLAPEAFIDWNRLNQSDSMLKVSSNYGMKLNVGYDFTDRFSLYGIMGASKVKYQQYFTRTYYPANDPITETNLIKTKSSLSMIYGLGARVGISPNLGLGIEYTSQSFSVKPSEETGVVNSNGSDFFINSKNRLNAIRLTLSYQFGSDKCSQ